MNSHVTLKKLSSIQQPLILRQKKHMLFIANEKEKKIDASDDQRFF
jgi:hypothetical protein